MTVIAVRNGIMAADTGARAGSLKRYATKLFVIDKAVLGFSGTLGDGHTFINWWKSGHDLDAVPEFKQYRGSDDAPDIHVMVMTKDGIELWTEHFQPHPIEMEYWAIGIGAQAALGAMHAGADAFHAVEAACSVVEGCDLPVIEANIEGVSVKMRRPNGAGTFPVADLHPGHN